MDLGWICWDGEFVHRAGSARDEIWRTRPAGRGKTPSIFAGFFCRQRRFVAVFSWRLDFELLVVLPYTSQIMISTHTAGVENASCDAPRTVQDRSLSVVLKALEQGLELHFRGTWIRMFKTGDVVRTRAGFVEADKDWLMCRVSTGGDTSSVTAASNQTSVYVDCLDWEESRPSNAVDNQLSWLEKKAQLLGADALAQISAASEVHAMRSRSICRKGSVAGARLQTPLTNVVQLRRLPSSE